VEGEVRELAELERECCAFAQFDVSASTHTVTLDVSAAREAAPAVRELFG
jgi:hypothetical protein